MIRNIVFDMGGVLLECCFDHFCDSFVKDPADRPLMKNELFTAVEWIQLDRGVITFDEAEARVKRRLPERLHETLHVILENWHTEAIPHADMEPLVRRLKAAGCGVYLLSNTASTYHTRLRPLLPAIDCFDGEFISADVHLLKPDPAIFRMFLKRFGLTAEECVFIDDVAANVEAAIYTGMSGVVFRGAAPLEASLKALGIAF